MHISKKTIPTVVTTHSAKNIFKNLEKYVLADRAQCPGSHWPSYTTALKYLSVYHRTYYTPLLVADNGHFLHTQCREDKMMMQVTFDLEAKQQFDQVRDQWPSITYSTVLQNTQFQR